jgi:hypothetical protein
MTTPREINRALKAEGLNVRIYRNLRGGSYYYFLDDGFDVVPSIEQYSLAGCSTESIVKHVRDAMQKEPS